ncbi:hypothetical protein [Scardovia wiggsiae]|uniref:hypothetical protein n=1 Tax=Scardovia wiggsiae TaxID=230143 RepID=UPI00374F3BEB
MLNSIVEASSTVLAADANSVVTSVLTTLSTWVVIGGGLWAMWGAVTLGGGLSDHNSPQIQNGVWKIVGGAIIIAAAALFKTVM